jgi:hypothetical protein
MVVQAEFERLSSEEEDDDMEQEFSKIMSS